MASKRAIPVAVRMFPPASTDRIFVLRTDAVARAAKSADTRVENAPVSTIISPRALFTRTATRGMPCTLGNMGTTTLSADTSVRAGDTRSGSEGAQAVRPTRTVMTANAVAKRWKGNFIQRTAEADHGDNTR
jgi:hypothetical protein